MWYYIFNEKPIGPIEDTQIIKMLREGAITQQTKVWKKGMQNWTSASDTELLIYLREDMSGLVKRSHNLTNSVLTPTINTGIMIIIIAIGIILFIIGKNQYDTGIRVMAGKGSIAEKEMFEGFYSSIDAQTYSEQGDSYKTYGIIISCIGTLFLVVSTTRNNHNSI